MDLGNVPQIGLLDLVNKNTEHQDKIEHRILKRNKVSPWFLKVHVLPLSFCKKSTLIPFLLTEKQQTNKTQRWFCFDLKKKKG